MTDLRLLVAISALESLVVRVLSFRLQASRHIATILKVYCANIQGEHARFLRQVEEFPIATNHASVYTRICDDLDAELRVPMKRHSLSHA